MVCPSRLTIGAGGPLNNLLHVRDPHAFTKLSNGRLFAVLLDAARMQHLYAIAPYYISSTESLYPSCML